MAKCMAPLLPHLAAEFFQHQPNCTEKLILRDVLSFDGNNEIELHPELDQVMETVIRLRADLAASAGPSCDLFKKGALLELTPSTRTLLMEWQNEETSFSSQLCELFGVSMVRIQDADEDSITPIESDGLFCDRCRKMSRQPAEKHCARCSAALEYLQ
ncbi:hypothetical protein OSTOST_01889 [Ostertagia ostertagi]